MARGLEGIVSGGTILIAGSFARCSLLAFPDHLRNFGGRNELAGTSKASGFTTRNTLGSVSSFNVEVEVDPLY